MTRQITEGERIALNKESPTMRKVGMGDQLQSLISTQPKYTAAPFTGAISGTNPVLVDAGHLYIYVPVPGAPVWKRVALIDLA